jgi:predicted O-methyltransferase YrrM
MNADPESWLIRPQVTDLLEHLYADAAENDARARQALDEAGDSHDETDFYRAMRHGYMAVGRSFGHLLYTLARSSRAKAVVEFGTSFGVSTIYLAAAIRDNGEGKVITTEFIAEKADQARENLAKAGLVDLVEFRVGDARETLKADLPEIDFVFLDGAKRLYLDVLKIVEPRLRPGAVIASDNTDNPELAPFLHYVRTPANGYISSAIHTPEKRHHGGHEITIRLK